MNVKELYNHATKTWAVDKQLIVVMEELSELTKEICKILRKDLLLNDLLTLDQETRTWALKDLIDELADVKIMVEQTEQIFQVELPVAERRVEKLQRLAERLNVRLD